MSTTTLDRSPVATTPLTPRTRVVTGILLISAAVLAATGAAWLSAAFGWPDVLDAPGTEALSSFAANESAVRTAFYLLLVSSLVLIPVAIYLEELFGGPGRPAVRMVTAFGVLGGFAQILGWVRWPVTVPHLSDAYAAAEGANGGAIASSYDVLNRYAGGALGEHLGWLFQGLWAVGIGILLLRVVGVPRWFALLGLGLAVLWLPMLWGSGLFAAEWLAPIGSTISGVWYVWLLALGVIVMVRRVSPASST
ncbi:MAG: DUF4386 family protein [Actinobacteria bacterium]|jgi:hypothetical protein|nr:DUF4386 family protein [Actinomycetota bacterium]